MKRFLQILLLCSFAVIVNAQETTRRVMKPTIMVVPEKSWCIQKGYTYSQNRDVVDYERALLDNDVLNVITRMGGIMEERGYPLKLLRSALDEIENETALDMVMTTKDGAEIQEDEYDKLMRVANADIIVTIAFDRVSYGPRQMMEFRVTSVDAATSKQIGGEVGRSSASYAPISVLLEEAVLGYMDNFTKSIGRHFNDIANNGREGTIIFKISESCPLNMDSEVTYNGESGELSELIDYWMNENSVNGSYSQTAKSSIRLQFEQVRFPLFAKGRFGGKQRAINAEGFVKSISSFLSQFGISTTTRPVGLGKVYVILGGL